MDQQAPIEVRIEYALQSGDTAEMELLPREYFDADLIESGAALDVDSDPLYFDTAEYLDSDPASLAWTKLSIRNPGSERQLTFHTSYWNGGRNQITSKTEWSEGIIVDEAVTVSLVTGDTVNHVIRAVSREGVLMPTYHRVFTTTGDGEDEQTIL